MAHAITITHGSTTITLTSGDYQVMTYNLGVPRTDDPNETVTDSFELRIDATSLTNLQADVRNINKALDLAWRRRKTGTGDRVYITFKESGDTPTFRAEIYNDDIRQRPGRLVIDSQWLGQPFFINASFVKALITYTRKSWEDNAETELELSNGGAVAAIGGISIRNPHTTAVFTGTTVSFEATDTIADSGDGFGIFAIGDMISLRGSTSNNGVFTVATVAAGAITVNETIVDEDAGDTVVIYDLLHFVDIDSTEITGDMPTPVRLELINEDAGASLETLWIGANSISDAASFANILDFADSNTGSDSSNAAAVSGLYRQYSITTTEAKVTGWTIEAATLTAAKSRWFKCILRSYNGTNMTDVKLRIKILYSTKVIYTGAQVEYDDTYAGIARLWREIDTVQLPPFAMDGNAPTDLTLELWGVSTSGGAETVDLDCIMLLPVDGSRKIKSLKGVAQNSIVHEDGILQNYYQEISSAIVRDMVAEGDHVYLWPGVDNRIYFVQHSVTANTADIDREMTVSAFYRPRRSII